jgi:pilus assembly protein CpaE
MPHPYAIPYCDTNAARAVAVHAVLGAHSVPVTQVEGLSALPADAEVALVGVSDLEGMLPALGAWSEAHPAMQLVVLTNEADATTVLRAIRAGVRDVVTDPEEARAAIARLGRRRRRPEAQGRQGRVVAVFALKGGVGKSTLSANLAIALNRIAKAPITAVDLSLPCGNLDMYLDLDAPRGVADVLTVGADLDGSVVRQALVPHACGVSLLAGARPGSTADVGAHSSKPLLDALATTRGITVVDVGSYLDTAQATALEVADLIVVPVNPLISSLSTMPAVWDHLAALGIPPERVVPVLNHTCPPSESLPADVVAELLRGAPRHQLPWGGVEVARSLNDGRPLCYYASRHPLSQAIGHLAEDVLGRVALSQGEALVRIRPLARAQEKLRSLFAPKEVSHAHA